MPKKLTDNIILTYRGILAALSNVVQTEEIDLDLPKGYGARIRSIEWSIRNMDSEISTGNEQSELEAALINDPDDVITVQIPEHTVQHDVIDDYRFEHWHEDDDVNGNGYTGWYQSNPLKEFGEDEDVLAVRNLRLNGLADDASLIVDIQCDIRYSLEKITNQELLALMGLI